MKSLLLVTLTNRLGGAERMIARLLDGLRSSHRVTLGLVKPAGPSGDSGDNGRSLIEWDGPTVGLRDILFGRYDVIHSHIFLPGLLIRIRRLWDDSFRWVHTVHYGESAYAHLKLGSVRRWIDREWIYPHTDRLVAVSPAIASELEAHPHLRLVENAIPLEPDERERPRPHHRTILGTVAHLRRDKGVDLLLDAARELLDRGHDVRVRVAGDGGEATALRRSARALGLENTVEFCGFVHDIDAFYRSLDVYVQPSRQEAFGIAALESMRFGLPLVARAIDNLPRLLDDGRFGILVGDEPDPATALADGIENALAHRTEYERRASEGLRHWRERYRPEKMVRAHRELYDEVARPAVCMISPVVTGGEGGLQRQLLLQSRELSRRGHRVFLVQRTDPELTRDRRKADRWQHVTVLGTGRLSGGRSGPGGVLDRLRGLAFIGIGLLRLWQIRRRIDVLHAHQLHSPTLLGVLGRRLLLKPVVTKVTSSGALGERAEIGRLPFTGIRRRAFRKVDRLLVLTPHMADEMHELGFAPKVVRQVPNSVEIPAEPVEQPKAADRPYRILFTGRLSTEKRLEDLLEAAGRLADEGSSVEVELVGAPDPDRDAAPRLRAMAEGLEVPVHFRGYRDDVAAFYRAADAFVLPSSTEGLSNALLEAMAFGLPCVVSDIPQNRFAVDDAGLVFRQGSAEDLTRTLARLVRDRTNGGDLIRRLSTAARRRARERFSVESVVDRLEEIYEEVAEGR